MVICFECSEATKRGLDDLLSSGSYSDYADVISAAVSNLSVLSKEVRAAGSIVFSKQGRKSRSPRGDTPGAVPNDLESPPIRSNSPEESQGATHQPIYASVPALFSRTDLPQDPPFPLPALPEDVFFSGQTVPVDRWIFGQYSKLLPAKASCRALAHLVLDGRAGLEIESAAAQIAQEAAVLGAFLADRDQRLGAARDDAAATGFPSSENADRGRLRFANQFVASMNKRGQLSGLLADLKFINIASARTRKIQLTKVGWTFATMNNPLLDDPESSDEKFSEPERRFLLDHIAAGVPAEDFAFHSLLEAIRVGHRTPESLDAFLRTLPMSKDQGMSDAFITTQRSGLISRMADLDLVTRVRDGVRVSYQITDAGKEYASRSVAA